MKASTTSMEAAPTAAAVATATVLRKDWKRRQRKTNKNSQRNEILTKPEFFHVSTSPNAETPQSIRF
jgi:hypothetical protein